MYELTVDSSFVAAHFLDGYTGDCARMHGHTWKVSVTIGANSLDKLGLCKDFKDIASVLDEIVDRFDHQTLNELEEFSDSNPTAENCARIIYDLYAEKIKHEDVKILSVTVAESDRYRVTYKK